MLKFGHSQYGQLKGSMELDTTAMQKEFRRVAEDRILSGDFAKEFTALDKEGPGVQKKLEELYEKASHSELAEGEARVRDRLGLKTI
jgi:ketol-acid reductoisomerase